MVVLVVWGKKAIRNLHLDIIRANRPGNQWLAYPYHTRIQVNACFLHHLVVHVKIQ